MRLLRRNMRELKYSLQGEKIPVYRRDSGGNIVYLERGGKKIPQRVGTKVGYGEPVPFKANISFSGGEAEAQEFGLSVSEYQATLVCEKGAYPLTEKTLIWFSSPVERDSDGNVDPKSADYEVLKVSPSLNYDRFVLKAVVNET